MNKNFKEVGRWWNDSSIELIEKDGNIYALAGWNGEKYYNCWDDCLDALREGNINSQRERDEAYRLLTSILDFCLENDVINDYDIYVVKELIEINPDED